MLFRSLGGTNLGLAIIAHGRDGAFEPVVHKTYRSRRIRSFPAVVARFLKQEARGLEPRVRQACIDFAGPVGRDMLEPLNSGGTEKSGGTAKSGATGCCVVGKRKGTVVRRGGGLCEFCRDGCPVCCARAGLR